MAYKPRSNHPAGLSSSQQTSTLRKLSLLALAGAFLTAFCFWADSIKVRTSLPSNQVNCQQERFYIFDTAELHATALKAIADANALSASGTSNTTHIVQSIIAQLSETHPHAIATEYTNPKEWVFNNAGGAMGSMFIIHASITE